MTENALVYLFGYPGVGKNTIAQIIERSSSYVAIQNHLISNAFRHVIAKQPASDYTKIEPLVKHHTMKAWLNFLDFIDAATPQQGLIFTSVLYDHPDSIQYFEYIRNWALGHKRPFVPVRLTCSREEILRRAQSVNRNAEFKLTDPKILSDIMDKNVLLTPTGDFLDLDITTISAVESAQKILAYIK
jgi:adenylate kinase family enzyme